MRPSSWLFVGSAGVAFFAAALAPSARACTCPAAGAITRDMAVERLNMTAPTTAIFEGTVESQQLRSGAIGAPSSTLSMTTSGRHRVVTLRSLRVYRGPNQAQFVVETGAGGGDCGFDFETGESYMVFAEPVGSGVFFTSICNGTELLAHSMAGVRLLRGEPPAPEDRLDYRSMYQRWTGGACGKVLRGDGQPLAHAQVFLSKIRTDGFPPETVDDPNLSQADGSFCVRTIDPGQYILGTEETDFEHSVRWIGFYPSGLRRSLAVPLTVTEGKMVSGLQFSAEQEQLFSVRVRAVTADGSPVPKQNLRVAISSSNDDPNEYHSTGRMNESASLEFRYVPAGRYRFASSFDPEFGSSPLRMPLEASQWRPETRDVEIAANAEVVLTLQPLKQ